MHMYLDFSIVYSPRSGIARSKTGFQSGCTKVYSPQQYVAVPIVGSSGYPSPTGFSQGWGCALMSCLVYFLDTSIVPCQF